MSGRLVSFALRLRASPIALHVVPVASSSSASASLPRPAVPFLARRALSTSLASCASGQGSREVKIKKKPKAATKKAAAASKAREQDDNDDDDDAPDWAGDMSGKKEKGSRRAGAGEDAEGAGGAAAAAKEVAKARDKMAKIADYFEERVEEAINRGKGKVLISVLDPVKVAIPGSGDVGLSSLSTASAKGNVITVNVFDEEHTKHVEKAIHEANLPGISPTKVDSRTIRITIPAASAQARAQLLKTLATQGEQAKTNVRSARAAGIKALGKDGAASKDDFQTATDQHVKAIDAQMDKAKKQLA